MASSLSFPVSENAFILPSRPEDLSTVAERSAGSSLLLRVGDQSPRAAHSSHVGNMCLFFNLGMFLRCRWFSAAWL